MGSPTRAVLDGAMMPQSPEDSDETDLGDFAGTETEEEDIGEMAEPFHMYIHIQLQ